MWDKKMPSEGDPSPHDSRLRQFQVTMRKRPHTRLWPRRDVLTNLALLVTITGYTIKDFVQWLTRPATVTQRPETITQHTVTMSASYAVAHPKFLEDKLQLAEGLEIKLIPASGKTGT